MPLTFQTQRTEKYSTGDFFAFRRLIKESLMRSYSDRTEAIQEHFGDLRFTQDEQLGRDGDVRLLVSVSAGTVAARELLDWVAHTMEERFLFEGGDVVLQREKRR